MKFFPVFLIMAFFSWFNQTKAADFNLVWDFVDKFEAADVPPTMAHRWLSIVSVKHLVAAITEDGNENARPLAREIGAVINRGDGPKLFPEHQLAEITALLNPYMQISNAAAVADR